MEEIVKKFIANPENFVLFRGENKTNQGGLHFTTDQAWAKNFGDNIVKIQLPADGKVKLINEYSFEEAYKLGLTSEKPLWDLIFKDDVDAIIGTDAMNSKAVDVIVNPKHLKKNKL